MRISILPSVLLLSLGACASTSAERNLAQATSVKLVAHQAQIKAFVGAQSDLNAENAIELDSFAEATATAVSGAARTTETWRLAKSDLVDQFTLVSAVDPTSIVAALKLSHTQQAPLTDDGAGAALDSMNNNLTKLATRPTAQEQFAELMKAASAVNTALASIQQAANAATVPAKGAAPLAAAAAPAASH